MDYTPNMGLSEGYRRRGFAANEAWGSQELKVESHFWAIRGYTWQ